MQIIKTFVIVSFFIGACSAPVKAIATEYSTPQPTATASIMPTATVEYQATAHVAETQVQIAQATADEANRIMVQATNDQQQRDHEAAMQNARGTEQTQNENFVRDSWTATAYQTSVPLTATAQVDNLTAIVNYKDVTIAQITATAGLPMQIVAEANARTQAQFAPLFVAVELFGLFGIGVFLLFAAWFMRWYWMREDARQVQKAYADSPRGVAERNGLIPIASESEPEFIQPVKVNRPITAENLKHIIPSAQEQFDIFAEKLVTGEMALSINPWETSGLISNKKNVRAWIKNMRGWMHVNKFGVFNENNEMTLVQAGKEWLECYLEHRTLPIEYQFGETAQ